MTLYTRLIRDFRNDMWLVEQNTRCVGSCPQNGKQQMAATAADVSNSLERREVVSLQQSGNVPLSFCRHARVKDTTLFGMFCKICEDPLALQLAESSLARADCMF